MMQPVFKNLAEVQLGMYDPEAQGCRYHNKGPLGLFNSNSK